MNCRTAEALAKWTQEVVIPTAKKELGADLAGLTQDSGYVCRTRYNRPGAKMSEHAKANAIDISAFRLAGREPVPVALPKAQSTSIKRFQALLHESACEFFTTVLGPGSNAAHATHFHLDLAERRSGYRVCDLGTSPAVLAASRGGDQLTTPR